MDRSHVDFTGSFADVYDRYLVPMDFAPYARRLAERVYASAPRRVLETAAGTGVVTHELARILSGDVSITATDLNEPMIALAQSKLGSERILGSKRMRLICLLGILYLILWCASSA